MILTLIAGTTALRFEEAYRQVYTCSCPAGPVDDEGAAREAHGGHLQEDIRRVHAKELTLDDDP
jgi:hypothetical protein